MAALLNEDLASRDIQFKKFLEDLSVLAAKQTHSSPYLKSLAKQPGEIQFRVFNGFLSANGSIEKIGANELSSLAAVAQKVAFDKMRSESERESAINFLGWTGQVDPESLFALLTAGNTVELQRASLQSLLKIAPPATLTKFMSSSRWSQLSPNLQEQLVAGMVTKGKLALALLDALEAKEIALTAISPAQRRQLQNSRDPQVSAKAKQLFATPGESDRMKVYEELKSVLELPADPKNGRKVFARVCAACHRLDEEGTAVGPDLFSIRNQPKSAILLHVIVPDYEISPGFNNYLIELKDGRTLSGIIRSETDNAITLRSATGQDETIPRVNIRTVQGSSNSMMPQGLKNSMTRQELADLMAYVKGE